MSCIFSCVKDSDCITGKCIKDLRTSGGEDNDQGKLNYNKPIQQTLKKINFELNLPLIMSDKKEKSKQWRGQFLWIQ